MKIKIHKNHEDSSKRLAQELIAIIKKNPQARIGLATGSSPELCYQNLIKDHQNNNTSYKEVTSFNLDEYVGLSQDHHQSYYFYMQEKLFKHLDIENYNIPLGTGNIEKNIIEYEKKVGAKPLDFQILGIGENGHIAFNEPGSKQDSITRVVNLTNSTIKANARFFENDQDVPKQAITMGIKTILQAKKIFLIASGKNKAKAIADMVKGDCNEKCPASFLQNHPDVEVFLDEQAASLLVKKEKGNGKIKY